MSFEEFLRDRRGSAVHWFAYVAVGLTFCCVAGAKGLDWLGKSGRMPALALVRPFDTAGAVPAGIDPTPTGSVPLGALRTPPRRD